MPVAKKVDDAVIGATINKSGTFQYRATKVGADTALTGVPPSTMAVLMLSVLTVSMSYGVILPLPPVIAMDV